MGRLTANLVTYPSLKLDHLLRLTDDTGIIQHALYSVPRATHGYCLDDNARALLAALKIYGHWAHPMALRLAYRYLAFIERAQRPDGRFHNFMDYDRQWTDEVGSEDAMARTLWALGYTVQFAPEPGLALAASDIFDRAVQWIDRLAYPRAWAYTILGLKHRWHQDGTSRWVQAASGLANRLLNLYLTHSQGNWRWFEPIMTYVNGRLPQALLAAYQMTGNQQAKQIGLDALNFLNSVCFNGEFVDLVGQRGWYANGQQRALFDQQPVDAKALAAANLTAWQVTGDAGYRRVAVAALEWFWGRNRHGLWLYSPSTGGCYDGLTEAGVNRNQGAESLLSFLLTYAEVYEASDPSERDRFKIEDLSREKKG
jgi:hypothetical protein